MRVSIVPSARGFLLAAVSVALVTGGMAKAAELSGVTVVKVTGKQGTMTQTERVYFKGPKSRTEIKQGPMGGPAVMIARPDKGVAWLLNTSTKTYIERRAPVDKRENPSDPSADLIRSGQATRKLVKTETVNGFAAEKYQLIIKDPAARGTTAYVWIAKKLGAMIKMQQKSSDGTLTMEMKDIKQGNVPDSLFELPKGYRKVAMPAAPKGAAPAPRK